MTHPIQPNDKSHSRARRRTQRWKPWLLAAAGAGLTVTLGFTLSNVFNISIGDILSNWFRKETTNIYLINPSANPSTEPISRTITPTNIYNSPTNIYNSPTNIYNSPTNIYNSPTNIYNSPTNIYNSPTNINPANIPIYRSNNPIPKIIVGFNPTLQPPIDFSTTPIPATSIFYGGNSSYIPSSPSRPSKEILISRLPVLQSPQSPEKPPSPQIVEQPQSPEKSPPTQASEGPPPGFSISPSSPTDIPEPPEVIATGVAILMLSWFAWHSRRIETAIQAASCIDAKK
jgi:hypothetical protein